MKNSAKKPSSVKKVLKKIKPYSFYLILALVSAIISVSLTLYIPVLTGNAIDNIIDKGNVDFASVIQILVYIGVGIGGVALFQWIMTYFTNIVSYRTVRDLRREVFEKFNTVPLSYIDTTPHGDLISRVINDVDAVGDGLTQMFLQLFFGHCYHCRHACIYADNQLENRPCCCCSHTAFALCCGIYRQDDAQPLYPSTGTQR